MKSRFFLWGCICGVGSSAAISFIGLLLYTSLITHESPDRNRKSSDEPQSLDQTRQDLLHLNEVAESTNLISLILELERFFETATFDQVLELFNQSVDSSNNYHTYSVQESLIEQLASVDPLATLEVVLSIRTSRGLELIPLLYSTWASMDSAEAIESAAQQSKRIQLLAVRAIISTIPVPLSSDIRELFGSLEIDEIVNEVLAEISVRELMQSSPQAAFEFIFSDNVDDVQQELLLSEVIGTWMIEPDDEDFSYLFNNFHDEYSKIDRSDARVNRVFLNLLNQIVQSDPRKFWELNLSNTSDLQSNLNFHILRAWSGLDPQNALQAISDIEDSEYYEESYRTVWTRWAQVEPTHVLQNIQQVQPEFRSTAIGISVLNLARQGQVDQAMSSIIQVKAQGENIGLAVRYLANTWVEYDAAAATNWLVTTDTINDTLRKDILNRVLPVLSNTDPLRAYQLAVEFGDRDAFDPRFTLEMRVMDSIAKRGDFERATELLAEVDESLMVTARSTIGQALISFGEIDDAIALGAGLSDADQTQYFQNIAILWFQLRPDELFENLTNLPKVQSQQAIAITLLQDWLEYRAEMSQDEISLLENLVSDIESF